MYRVWRSVVYKLPLIPDFKVTRDFLVYQNRILDHSILVLLDLSTTNKGFSTQKKQKFHFHFSVFFHIFQIPNMAKVIIVLSLTIESNLEDQ
jgi:hypothetical protein